MTKRISCSATVLQRAARAAAAAVLAGVLGGVLGLGLLPARACAQDAPAQAVDSTMSTLELLGRANALENGGDFPGAESLYREVLRRDPAQLGALISLERVLRAAGRVEEILPIVRRHLEVTPDSPIGHQMLLRIYRDLGRPSDFDQAAEAWIRAAPGTETPYREIARLRELDGDAAGALAVLKKGRAKLGDDALAPELGFAYADAGQPREAVREWSRAVDPDGDGFSMVQRLMGRLPDGGASVAPDLVDALARGDHADGRTRAALALAVQAGLAERAMRLVEPVVASLDSAARIRFIAGLARQADAAQVAEVSFWAWSRLAESGAPGIDPAEGRSRVARLALVLGDTAQARRSFESLQADAAPGSLERRRSTAEMIRLMVRRGELGGAEDSLKSFRAAFRRAPELDGLAASVATALLARGDSAAARAALEGVDGPQSGMARARMALAAGGAAEARAALLAAAPGLDGADATRAIALARLLGRLSPDGTRLVGRALAKQDAGNADTAVVLVLGGVHALQEDEQAAVLSFAAGIAEDAGLDGEADQIRRELIRDHGDAVEAPEAMLALGRSLARTTDGQEEAKKLFETLVIEHPRSALVPQARQELEKLQRHERGAGSET